MSNNIKLKKRKDILSLLDFVFALGQSDGKESYAYAFNQNGGMMTVADCDATGTVGELQISEHASRITAGTMDAMFQLASNREFALTTKTLSSFHEEFEVALQKNMVENFEDIPSVSYVTLLMQCEHKEFRTAFLNKGNQKLFFLGKDGLILLTPRDGNEPAYGSFFTCPLPGILLCVSNSCFERFEGPMDFEYAVLDALCDSQTVEGFKSLLTKKITAEGKESFILLAAGFGFGSFKSFSKALSNRKSNLYWNVLSKETNATPYEAQAMINAYNKVYLSYQPDFDEADFAEADVTEADAEEGDDGNHEE